VIQINLLPAEYRRVESTPIARFIAIVVGAIVVTSGLVAYGYVHYSKLRTVRDLRIQTEASYQNKKQQADRSQALLAESRAYEARRAAIQEVARERILQSRKLDEFLDIIDNKGDHSAYFVWLEKLDVTKARQTGRGQPETGGTWSFSGYSESIEFSKITKLRETMRNDPFFDDFSEMSRPNFKAVDFDDDLEPSSAGKFSYSMELKPLGWRYQKGNPNNR